MDHLEASQVNEPLTHDEGIRRAPREWLAYKLVCLAHRLHNPEFGQRITIEYPDGHAGQINITGNEYGCGISSISGVDWLEDGHAAQIGTLGGCRILWHDIEPDSTTGSI